MMFMLRLDARKALAAAAVLAVLAMLPAAAGAAVCSSTGDGAWTANIWGGACPAGGPTANDDVTINAGHDITFPVGAGNYFARSLTFSAAGGAANLTHAANQTLTVGAGGVTINSSSNTNNSTKAWRINDGSATVNGNVTLQQGSADNDRLARIFLTSGPSPAATLTINGNLTFTSGNAVRVGIDMAGGSASGQVNLSGQFTVNTTGTLAMGTGTAIFNYNGTAAQTVRVGVSSVIYRNLHLNNSDPAGATLSAAITTTNVTGNVRVQGGILNNGGFAIASAGGGDVFELASGTRFNLTGTSGMPSGFTTYSLAADSTTSFQGANQAVAAVSVTSAVQLIYGHVIAQGGGTKTAGAATPPAALNIAGDFSIENATTFTANSNDPIVNVTGNMAINGSGIYQSSSNAARALSVTGNLAVGGTYTGNGAPLNITGDFTRTGTFTSGTGVVTFNSASMVAPQTLTGATTFTSMTVNNTGLGLSLANNMTVTTAAAGSLVLTNGVVTTGANVLIVARACNNAASVTRTNGYVVGNYQKAIPNGATTCLFELGGGGDYSPASLAFTGVGGTGGGLIGRVGLPVGDHPNIGTSGLNSTKSVNRWWGFTTTGVTGTALPAFTSYGATLTFVAGDVDGGANTANFEIERWNGAAWSVTTVGTRTATSTQATGITALGELAIAEKAPVITPPDSFNAVEVGAAVNGRIFTKLRGAGFTLDIVALNSGGTLEAGFTDTVQVDLMANAAATSCAGGSPIGGTSQNVNLSLGRGTTTAFSVATAYPNVRVRVQYPTLALTRCSADNFSIKPTAFTITSTDATNLTTGGGATIKTGATFNLTAAGGAGYTGTPGTNFSGNVTGTPTAGTLGPVAPGFLTADGSGAASGTFYYGEVGHFGLKTDAVRDTSFTSVDPSGTDCIASSTSETLSGGQYGCWVGSNPVAAVSGLGFGRFIPDNFNVAYTTPPIFGTVCGTFTYVGTLFTFPGSTGIMTVTARAGTANSLGNATTVNYAGSYAKLTTATLNQAPYNTKAARYTRFDALNPSPTPALDHTGLPDTATDPTVGAFTNGVGTLTFSSGTGLAFVRDSAAPNAQFSADIALALNVIDEDAVAFGGNPASFGSATSGGGISFSGGKAVRYGRLRIANANGSPLVPLAMLMETQYWNGSSFVTNADDNCTSLGTASVGLGNYTSNLNSGETTPTIGGGFVKGRRALTLSAPGKGNNGSVQVVLNLGTTTTIDTCPAWSPTTPTPSAGNLAHLRGRWCGATYTKDPTARATFGAAPGAGEVIHSRELLP